MSGKADTPWGPNYIGEGSGAECYGDMHRAALKQGSSARRRPGVFAGHIPSGKVKGAVKGNATSAGGELSCTITEKWLDRPARKIEQSRRQAKAVAHAAWVAKVTSNAALRSVAPETVPAIPWSRGMHIAKISKARQAAQRRSERLRGATTMAAPAPDRMGEPG
jgi:hypothetical protein